ncbi:unnamed protein product [Paramecium pentaurelia]|uniref:Sfi1 spindle body domain-containing protein n=1 Tax=Paramecium pentaurelia TaxID=43138 RepID=A0A8S1TTL2_9CILI|nr:unnamed protein product [Paramecium pentaurelia]
MIKVESDVTPNFQPQRDILKQMEETMMVLQRPKLLHAPLIQQEEFSQQSMLLKEIDFFCQRLTTVKKTKPKVEDVSTKQFTCSTPEIQKLQMLIEPDEMDEQQHQVKFADEQQQDLEKIRTIPTEQGYQKRTGIVRQQQPKLIIKKLEFELENQPSWIPVKIEKKLEQELKINLNLCIFWPEEELANLRTQNINILSIIENMKNINYFNQSIKQQNNNNCQDFTILSIQLLQQLKIFSIILCLNYIHPIRELCIRANEIKRELLSEALYERKKNMLLLEQKRITKKLFLRYMFLRVKYKSAIQKILNDTIQIRQMINKKKCFQKLYLYSQRNKSKNEFYELVCDHMRVQTLNRIFQNWRIFQQFLVRQRITAKSIKNIILRQSLHSWQQNTQQIIQQEKRKLQIEKEQREKAQIVENQKENDEDVDDNQVLSQFLTDEKPRDMYEGPYCLNDIYTIDEREVQARKIKVIIFELKEDLKLCPNLMQKVFIKWKIAFLQRHRQKEFIQIMQLRKMQKVFKFWKNDKEYHPFYQFLLKRKGLEGFRYNQLTNKQQKLQDQLKIITLKQQRQQIEDMAIEIYNKNVQKKAFYAWKYQLKNENLHILWQSLSDQKLKQDFQIVQLKYDIIQKKRKIKYFKKWVLNFIKSRRSIKNLQQCEVTAKEKAIESLIRIAFETSMKTQFKWLEYYKDN